MTPPNALALFQLTDWSVIPVEQIAEGVTRQMVVGERVMVCRLVLAPRTVTAIHSHVHEQLTMVERQHVVESIRRARRRQRIVRGQRRRVRQLEDQLANAVEA